jgi:excinuclease ABC subunit C
MEILNTMDIRSIAVLAIAKGEKRNAGLETFYLGTEPNTPIYLDLKGDLIHLLQRLRDEAHRFAIGTHRTKRAKNMLHTSLTDIEEIGEKRKKNLLLHFGSVREIAGASVEQLMRVSGINEKIAKKIYTFYHG